MAPGPAVSISTNFKLDHLESDHYFGKIVRGGAASTSGKTYLFAFLLKDPSILIVSVVCLRLIISESSQ